MKNFWLLLLLVLEILLCVVLAKEAIQYMVSPEKWRWPIVMSQRGTTLLGFSILALATTTWLGLNRFAYRRQISFGLLLFIVTSIGGILIGKYFTFSFDVDAKLASFGIFGQADFDSLSPCERFEMFMNVSYKSLGTHDPVVAVPEWLHNSLGSIPEDVAVGCIVKLSKQQVANVEDINKDDRIDVAKIHVLIFEAFRLKLVFTPEIMDLMGFILQGNQSAIDRFGWIERFYCAPLNLENSVSERKTPIPNTELCR